MEELVFGLPHAAVINAAFCHAHPLGGRSSAPERGAWYAGFELSTAQAQTYRFTWGGSSEPTIEAEISR